MAFSYDLSTNRGKVRLLIGDGQQAADEDRVLMEDEEIDAFLALYSDSPRLAAAACLDRIATTQVLLVKKMTSTDWATDGPAMAKSLREQAAQFRAEYAAGMESESGSVIDVIELIYDDFSQRQQMVNELLRSGG